MRWEDLNPVPGGRYCDACRKAVVDVEQLTAAELDALVESGARACVRVTTLADGTVLTRDRPRALRRMGAWAGAALAASTMACSERSAEEEVAAHADWETRGAPRSAVAKDEVPPARRPIEAAPNGLMDRSDVVTIGGLEPTTLGGFEPPPETPAFDFTPSVFSPEAIEEATSAVLGGIGETRLVLDEAILSPFEPSSE